MSLYSFLSVKKNYSKFMNIHVKQKKPLHREVYTVWFHSYKIQNHGETKLWCQSQDSGGTVGSKEVTGRWHMRIMFYILFWTLVPWGWSLCENSWRYTLWICKYINPVRCISEKGWHETITLSSFSSLSARPEEQTQQERRWAVWKHIQVWLGRPRSCCQNASTS